MMTYGSRSGRSWRPLLLAAALGATTPAVAETALTVQFVGVTPAFAPDATVTGPNGFSRTLSTSAKLTDLEPGEYLITSRASGKVQAWDPIPGARRVTLEVGTSAVAEITYIARGYPITNLTFFVTCEGNCPWVFENAAAEWQSGDAPCAYVVLQVRSATACEWTTQLASFSGSEAAAPGPNPKPPFVINGYGTNTTLPNQRLSREPLEWRLHPAAPMRGPPISQPAYGAPCGYVTPQGGRYWYPVAGGIASGIEAPPLNPGPMGATISRKLQGEIRFKRF